MTSSDTQPKDEGHFSYDVEADILSWEISRETAIESVREVGNVIIHVTNLNLPVLIEILNASHLKPSVKNVFENAPGPALGPEAAGV